MTSEKVPSDIAYGYVPSPTTVWGFQIPDVMPRHKWIKLGLVPQLKTELASRLSAAYQDPLHVDAPRHKEPADLVTDYLSCLREHVVHVLKTKIGRAFDGMEITWVITVPAMWPDAAKAQTLASAEEAGMGSKGKIRILSEPEAAAIHALKSSNPHDLQVGDTIVICDAGGGTVDLITFKILELEPNLRLKEEAPGNGSLCGSTFLNRRFEKLLETRLASCPEFKRDTLEEAHERFETAKRRFAGNRNEDFMIPVPGIPDDQSKSIFRGRLRLTGDDMADIFEPVLKDVLRLVKEQIVTTNTQVKSVLLVGGFGQSPYLRKYIREHISKKIDVIQVVDGWTAVVRGALTKTLAEVVSTLPQTVTESRMARKNYGLIMSTEFNPLEHDAARK